MTARRPRRHVSPGGAPAFSSMKSGKGEPGAPPLWVATATDAVALGAVAAGLLCLYALTTPSTVLLEDDGLFLMSAATLGISHPPGYPVYSWLGWLAAQVPVGTTAYRIHLLSGVLGAMACAAVGWIVVRRTGSRPAAWASALALGVSEHFWSQAIIAEVYTLNALLCLAVYALCLEANERPLGRIPVAAAALYGLALANHWPLVILATPVMAAAAAGQWRAWLRRAPVLLGTATIAVAVPYAWMVWRSNQDPAISFYGPLDSWRDVMFYLSRRGYSGVEASPTATWQDSAQFARYAVGELGTVLTPIGAGVALWGALVEWRRRARLIVLGEGVAIAAGSVLLAFLLGFDFDYLQVAVFRPYPLVTYGLLAVWLGVGASALLEGASGRGRVTRLLLSAALLALPVVLVARNVAVNNRSTDTFADDHARLLLTTLEPNAVLLVYGDADTGPIGYVHEIERVRPDVTIYNLQGLVFRNRMLPALSSAARRQERWQAFLQDNQRPIYHMTDRQVPTPLGEDHFGFVKRLRRQGEAGPPSPEYRPESDAFFRRLMTLDPSPDRWVRVRRNQLTYQYSNFLALADLRGEPSLRERIRPLVALARGSYFGLSGLAEVLIEHGTTRADWERATGYLAAAEKLRDETLDAERLGREAYLLGFVAFRLGNLAASRQHFQESIETDPSPSNGSHLALQQLASLPAAQPGR